MADPKPAGTDLELMQHVDGELDEAADREVELRIGREPEARAKVDALGEVGELLRGHLELATDAVPDRRFDQIWREIDKQIDLAAAPAPAAGQAERAASESVMNGLPAQASLWRRVTHWLDRKRGYVVTAMVSAGAVAAIALVARPGGTGAAPTEQAAAHRPAELEALDTPGGTWTMMNVSDEDGAATVIWVTPEDTVEGL